MLEAFGQLGVMAASAFLAATILPFPSEATFAALLHAGRVDAIALFVVATIFNTLGSCVNWWIGRLAAEGGIARLPQRLRPSGESMEKARLLFARYGWPSLIFSWVPGVGDLATLAAGLLRHPFPSFVALVGIGKALRYAGVWAGWTAVVG